jgi:hypothetical protein
MRLRLAVCAEQARRGCESLRLYVLSERDGDANPSGCMC